MSDIQSTLRICSPENARDISAYAEIARWAFHMPPPDEFDWIAGEKSENILLAKNVGKVLGGLILLPVGQWFGGKSIPMTGIRAVCVSPEARSQGAASTLMNHALNEIHTLGVPLSTLYPATQPVYRRQGYELAGAQIVYELALDTVDIRDHSLAVRTLEKSDLPEMKKIFVCQAQRTNGNLDRNDWLWDRQFYAPKKHIRGFLIGPIDRPEGYVLLSDRPKSDGPTEIVIHDWCVSSSQAVDRLLSLLADHRSTTKSVYWRGAPVDPLRFLATEQKSKIHDRFEWMLRIVDVKKSLEARGYPPDINVEIAIRVHDDVLSHNDGTFLIHVNEGTATVEPGSRPEIEIDVRGLATVYASHLSPMELAVTQYVDGEYAALQKLGQLFAGPHPWMSDMF